MDQCCRPDRADLVWSGLIRLWVKGSEKADDTLVRGLDQGIIDQPYRALLSHGKGKPHHRVHDHPAQR
jgi:hypothetical protein